MKIKISKQTTTTAVLMVLTAISTYFMLNTRIDEEVVSETKKPDAFAIDIKYEQYDTNGELSQLLTAEKAVHYPYQDTAIFKKPNFQFYTKEKILWHITAEEGKSTQDNKTIDLNGNVIAIRAASVKDPEMTIKTSALTIHKDQQVADTQEPLTVIRPNSTVHSKGGSLNLKTGETTFK